MDKLAKDDNVSDNENTCMCPVCGYDDWDSWYNMNYLMPPYSKSGQGNDEICPCCSFQYNYDDNGHRYQDSIVAILHGIWRLNWIRSGYLWASPSKKPADWDPIKQLNNLSEILGINWREFDD